ncbi:FAST kinase domain-containing protein 2, mitochondrial [Aplochiton taeniatus]
MSARVTGEEVLRWALRLCSRRSLQSLSPLAWGTSPSLLQEQAVAAKRVSFYDRLQECGSPTDVLDLVAQFTPTQRRISNCLTRIWEINKKMTEEQRRYELPLMFEHAGFKELLQKVMQDAGLMRTSDLAYCLLATVKLGVGQRSRVVQTLLRICQERLNEFDEKSLSILASCLEHMESNANVDALKDGIRLLVASRLPGIKKVMTVQTMMRLIGRDAPPDLKKKLEMKALSMTDQFSLPNSQYMISTMATMNFHSKALLDICSARITENVHNVPFNRLLLVLRSCKELHYRHLGLLTAVSEHVASTLDIWSNRQVILFLSAFEDLSYCPSALMEAFSRSVVGNPDALTLKDVLSILKSYSSLNYDLQGQRQEFLDSVSRVLQSYLTKMSPLEVLKAVHCLCLLGHFPPGPLEHLLASNSMEELSTTGDKSVRGVEMRLRMVDTCLRFDRPLLPRPLSVPDSALGTFSASDVTANPALCNTLASILEGGLEGTLEEGVMVENQYLIDGVISRPLQSTSLPSDGQPAQTEHSQRIAVICPPPSSFCYGTSHPRGNLPVKIRHLKILGYNPVVVAQHELESLSEEERCNFLRARIFPEPKAE